MRNTVFCQGRGSATLPCYCLGITAVDPIANHLLFKRSSPGAGRPTRH
ncbi:MAG: hypothetical protein U1U88_000681 [Lawsonella clevelandensis]